MTTAPAWDHRNLHALLEQHQAMPGGLLPLLHAVQNSVGYVPADAVPDIAAAFRLTRADVHGVISFYHYFRSAPPGRHLLQVCRAEACQARGSRALERHIKQSLGVDYHGTTPDGEYTLEPVYCLGNCACAPNAMLNGELHGRVDVEDLLDLLEEQEARA